VGGRKGSLYLEAVLGVLWADDFVELDTDFGPATVDEDWLALGGTFGLGWNFPLGGPWRVRPGGSMTLGYIENEAR